MTDYPKDAIIEFLRRSYAVVDGLWFMTVEQEQSYRDAMRLDQSVWGVMPKIQAKKVKQLLESTGDPLKDLEQGVGLKMVAEGYTFNTESSKDSLKFTVLQCPWLDILKRSDRMHVSKDICSKICGREMQLWAAQYAEDISFEFGMKLSDGCDGCELCFKKSAVEAKV